MLSSDNAAGASLPISPDFLAAALAQVGDAIIMVDAQYCVTYLNERAAKQYEIGGEMALGRHLNDLYQYEWLKAGDEQAALLELARDGHWRGENYHVLPSGTRLYVESTVTVLHDDIGRQYMMAVIRDMTAQKQAEKALRAVEEQVRHNEERLRRMMETSQIGIAFALPDGTVLDCNDALLRVFGVTRSEYEVDGLNWRQLAVDKELSDRVIEMLDQSGFLSPFERVFRRKDGSLVSVMVSSSLLTMAGGADHDSRDEHVAFVVDLTELKQAQAALQELNNSLERRVAERTSELERSNQELDRFAYVVSHDLKSPLRGIDHLATWIAQDSEETLTSPAREYLAKLRGRVRRMERLLDDLLQYSRAGRNQHTPEPVDTAALVHNIVELLNPPPGFQVQIEGEMPTIRCERPPLETVLRNLIGNAVKHHDRPSEGFVIVSAQSYSRMVEFRVRDNGPGIDPEYHDRIFELFQTLRPRDEVEGSGMGLAIVKKTVESAGGKIWVESAKGEGSAFCFTWPEG